MFWNINRRNLERKNDKFFGKDLGQYPFKYKTISLVRCLIPNSIYNYDGGMYSVNELITNESVPATYNENTYKIDFTGTYTTNDENLAFRLGLIAGKTYNQNDSGDYVISIQNNTLYLCSNLSSSSSSIITTGISTDVLGILEYDASNGFILKEDYNNVVSLSANKSVISRFNIWFEDATGRVISEINDFNIVLKLGCAY